MDKGAHFHKCDFQVHSPRDQRWSGATFGVAPDQINSLTDEQKDEIRANRIQFAKEYLEKARNAGLHAIAITDHHDVLFAKIIRNVAELENAQYITNGTPDLCITVFPGIELTLNTPICQCLILFDSDLPDQQIDLALTMFGINSADEFAIKTVPTERISTEQIQHLTHLHKKLDDSTLKGRYILLPNVNYNGTSTLLRAGQHDHYKKMPCVGGYVDGDLSTETGWLNKLNGGDVNYGHKAIGIISTSDNRYEDGREFGKHFTWIKWAEPSAEALRQACLARQSRISQEEPVVPQIFITKIDVTYSKFLGSFSIEFNKQYNSLIGGRGTGKSTILEYLRWGLCDQINSASDPDELNDLERRRRNLIEKTLTEFGAEVRITFTVNGIYHIIKRNSATRETSLKIDDGEFRTVSEGDIRNLLPIQAYSQKQLSSVGVSTDELKRFIQIPIATGLANLDFQLFENITNTQTEYQNVIRKKEIQAEVDRFSLEINSLVNQLGNLRRSLTGISDADQIIIGRKQIYDGEANLVSNIQRELNIVRGKIEELGQTIQIYPQAIPVGTALVNSQLISDLDVARTRKLDEVKTLVRQLQESLSGDSVAELQTLIGTWQQLKSAFDADYELAKSRTTSNRQQLGEIQRLEQRLAQIRESVNERNARLVDIGQPEQTLAVLRNEYWQLFRDTSTLLNQEAVNFTNLSKGLISIEVERNLDTTLIKNELIKSLAGTRINSEKIQTITDGIKTSIDPLEAWRIILTELQYLAETSDQELSINELRTITPKLIEYGLNEGNLRRLIEVLNPEIWLNLSTIKLEFTPDFQYTTNIEMGDKIPFSSASAGQQATALLTVLLNQPGTPLIIDQPEEDIDNRAIDEIIKNIWEAKKSRQLIFTSHNANLVVNGDAELVICCDYRDTGNQTRGYIKAEGAIDSSDVRKEITSVMEGGEKAFKLRKDKYGF